MRTKRIRLQGLASRERTEAIANLTLGARGGKPSIKNSDAPQVRDVHIPCRQELEEGIYDIP